LARNGVKSVEALSRLTTAEIRMWPNVGAKALEALAFDLARVGVPLPGATVKQPSPCYRLDDPALRKALISLGWTPPE
jgi:hypothetical protein